ncbi:MAG: flagellar basal-body rod modification protein FlgD [Planctomycetota bacterium]|jgi:flagellar basal-body rod modification protein FlgD
MEISGISSSDSPFGIASAGGNEALGKDTFMTLLVEQLKNQDPLEPTANEQFVAELANFSSLEEAEKLNKQMGELNENILGMVVLQQSNALLSQLTESSALIGDKVKFYDFESQSIKEGEVTSVKIEEGLALLKIDGEDVPLANVTEVLGDSESGDSSEDSTTDN